MPRGHLVLVAALVLTACKSDRAPKPTLADAPPAGAPVSAREPEVTAPAVELPLTGEGFAGSLRLAVSLGAPLVVLLPKTHGTRRELAPFVTRALEQGLAAHTLVLDPPAIVMPPPAKGTQPALSEETVAKLVANIRAAIAVVDARVTGTPPLVLVGSDFGSTLAVHLAKAEPRVRAAALVSPGVALHGVEIYRAYSGLLGKPVFLAAGASDTVAADPLITIAAMGRDKITKKIYPGVGHGAGALLESSPVIADDLSLWLRETVVAIASEPASAALPPAAPSAAVPSPPASALPAASSASRKAPPPPATSGKGRR